MRERVDPKIPLSRMAAILSVTTELPLPDVESGDAHLCMYLEELGMCAASTMGLSPLSWSEIDSWCRLTNTSVTPGEASMLVAMSRSFVRGSRAEEAPFMPRESTIVVSSGSIVCELSNG